MASSTALWRAPWRSTPAAPHKRQPWVRRTHFVSSGTLVHPITRRVLLAPELARMRKQLSPTLALLLRHSGLHTEWLARYQAEQYSLRDFQHTQAGEALNEALLFAEEDTGCARRRVARAIDAYEDSLSDILATCPETRGELLTQQLAIVEQRRKTCELHSWYTIRDVVRDWLSRASGSARHSRPAMFVSWLRSC